MALELDAITVIGFVVLAALITLAIWAPGPLSKWRAQLGAGAVAIAAFILGRGTKRPDELTDDDTPRIPPRGPSTDTPLDDALETSDDILTEAEHDPPHRSPYADLSGDELRRALESATGTGPDEQ